MCPEKQRALYLEARRDVAEDGFREMGCVEGLGLKMPEQHEEAGDKPSGTKTCSSQQCKRKNCTGLGQGLPGALCPKQVSISFASGK